MRVANQNLPLKSLATILSKRALLAALVTVAMAATNTVRADLVDPYSVTSDLVFARYAQTTNSQIVNHGSIIGSADEPVVFAAGIKVSGSGYFEHTLTLGTFAPGNSPGITTGSNQAFGASSTIEFELGGTTPGFGAGKHDQINDSGTIQLIGAGPTLSILPFGGFVPQPGDQFQIMTWQTALSGSFGTTLTAPYFAGVGITFQQVVDNPGGVGSFTLIARAIPEASPLLIWSGLAALALGAVIVRRGRLRRVAKDA